MTEINHDYHIEKPVIRTAKNADSKDSIKEFTPEGEIREINLDKNPCALYGRGDIRKVKIDGIEEAKKCEANVEEALGFYMENPELCDFMMNVCDKYIKKGYPTEIALDKTAEFMNVFQSALNTTSV